MLEGIWALQKPEGQNHLHPCQGIGSGLELFVIVSIKCIKWFLVIGALGANVQLEVLDSILNGALETSAAEWHQVIDKMEGLQGNGRVCGGWSKTPSTSSHAHHQLMY